MKLNTDSEAKFHSIVRRYEGGQWIVEDEVLINELSAGFYAGATTIEIAPALRTLQNSGSNAGKRESRSGPQGFADNLNGLIIGIEQEAIHLEKTNITERNQLAFGLVAFSPHALGGLPDDSKDSIHEVMELNEGMLRMAASRESPEIKLLNRLIKAARQNVKGRYFSWMDPYADPLGGLVLGSEPKLRLAKLKLLSWRYKERRSAPPSSKKWLICLMTMGSF